MRRLWVVVTGFLIESCLLACSSAYGVSETGAQFLKIGVGARACAMGEAFVALTDGAGSIYWNPAGMTRSASVEVMATHNAWLLDMSRQDVAVVVPSSYGSFGGAITYSSSGDIPGYENFEYLGDYSAYDFAGTFAFARVLSKGISLGAGLKLIQQKIEEETATGFAADLGLLYESGFVQGVSLGFAVQNLGPGVKFIEEEDPLPLNIKGGIGYVTGPLRLAGDLNKPRDNDLRLNIGAELVVRQLLALRVGYDTQNTYTAGLGVIWRNIAVDYAVVPYEDLDDTHRVSVSVRF